MVSGDVEETKQVSILFQIIHDEIVDAVDFIIAQFIEHVLKLIEDIFLGMKSLKRHSPPPRNLPALVSDDAEPLGKSLCLIQSDLVPIPATVLKAGE